MGLSEAGLDPVNYAIECNKEKVAIYLMEKAFSLDYNYLVKHNTSNCLDYNYWVKYNTSNCLDYNYWVKHNTSNCLDYNYRVKHNTSNCLDVTVFVEYQWYIMLLFWYKLGRSIGLSECLGNIE